ERGGPGRAEAMARGPVVPVRRRLFQDLLRRRSAERDTGPDRHVPADTPVADGAVTQRLNRLLLRHEPEHLLRLDELLAGLAHADVDHDFLDPDVPHARHGPT